MRALRFFHHFIMWNNYISRFIKGKSFHIWCYQGIFMTCKINIAIHSMQCLVILMMVYDVNCELQTRLYNICMIKEKREIIKKKFLTATSLSPICSRPSLCAAPPSMILVT